MSRTLKALLEPGGTVRLLEPVKVDAPQHALLTILEDSDIQGLPTAALLSEASLAADWLRPEEDEAWAHLQQGQ